MDESLAFMGAWTRKIFPPGLLRISAENDFLFYGGCKLFSYFNARKIVSFPTSNISTSSWLDINEAIFAEIKLFLCNLRLFLLKYQFITALFSIQILNR